MAMQAHYARPGDRPLMAAFSVLSCGLEQSAPMSHMSSKGLICALLAAVMLYGAVPGRGLADDDRGDRKEWRDRRDDDHDDVFGARREGAVMSLPQIREILRDAIDGEIIGTDFEYEDGHAVYEFKYVDRRGRVREIKIDARNGRILKHELDD